MLDVAVFVLGLVAPAARPTLRAAVVTARATPAPTMLLPESFLLAETLESLAELGGSGAAEPHRPFTFFLTNLLIVSLVWKVFVAPLFQSDKSSDMPEGYGFLSKGYKERFLNKDKATPGDSAETKRLSSFGWLQADMRTPLPSLEELSQGCHLVGVRDGHQMFLCAAGAERGKGPCGVSDDFSTFYGAPVYICQGGAVF